MIEGAVFSCLILLAQAQRPPDIVKWTAHLTQQSASAATIDLSADIQSGWHVYALSEPTGGPNPLTVSLPEGEAFALNGPVHESAPTRHFDPTFKMETAFYLNHVQLIASIKKSKGETATSIPINVRFQACSDNLCMPPYTAHLIADSAAK
jgi:DsbC/DsbD-like thiol-disulfide interchange protein